MKAEPAEVRQLIQVIAAAIPDDTPADVALIALLALLASTADQAGNTSVIAHLMHAAADELVKEGPRFGQSSH